MKKTPENLADETRIVHGIKTRHTTTMDLVPPIHMTATYAFQDLEHGSGVFAGTRDGYVYTRISNPTVDLLQEKTALLEGAQDAVATASGMAAVASIPMSLARPGDNVVVCNAVYGGTYSLFNTHLRNFDITPRFITPKQGNTRKAIETLIDTRTRLLYMETPANPTLDILDIDLWASIAKAKGIPLAVDNTFASPFLQKPLSMGADLVVHSATKYLCGHGDIVGGIVVGTREMINLIRRETIHHFGPVMSPFNAWLVLRGIKTLAIRMNRHSASAMDIARWLESHPKVARVYYPGLESHPAHELAKKQMKQFSGIIAFEVKGGMESGKTLLNSVNLCILAVSLGDCETLIQHPASMTHATYSKKERMKAGISEGLIRLSVGLEHPGDITHDIGQALDRIR
ncbi:MAG: aminotransferase class I/II-fold pyridoxal phosphate-dependent enzyme [Pseudomonadota bacterium]